MSSMPTMPELRRSRGTARLAQVRGNQGHSGGGSRSRRPRRPRRPARSPSYMAAPPEPMAKPRRAARPSPDACSPSRPRRPDVERQAILAGRGGIADTIQVGPFPAATAGAGPSAARGRYTAWRREYRPMALERPAAEARLAGGGGAIWHRLEGSNAIDDAAADLAGPVCATSPSVATASLAMFAPLQRIRAKRGPSGRGVDERHCRRTALRGSGGSGQVGRRRLAARAFDMVTCYQPYKNF